MKHPAPGARPGHLGGRAAIAIVGHRRDGHARSLIKRLEALGARASFVELSAVTFSTLHPGGLVLPGFGPHLPDGVIVRGIAAGSFEAVTRRLGVLHALREHGVLVWNDARAIERCVDKSMTSFLIARAGVPTPDTWTVEGRAEALRIARRETIRGPLVLKPLFGSQGRGLKLIGAAGELPDEGAVAGVYYLQRFVGGRRAGAQRFSGPGLARKDRRRHAAPGGALDHQCETGRPARSGQAR